MRRVPTLPAFSPRPKEERSSPLSNTVVIDPIARIEGHAKISILLDDAGAVSGTHCHGVEYRSFEKFCKGRPFTLQIQVVSSDGNVAREWVHD